MTDIVPMERVERTILVLRGQKVILDADLAVLYGVPTKAFNQAVKRNRKRFPPDFIFKVTPEEKRDLVTNCDHLSRLKFSPALPYAFTEHGAIMAATILNKRPKGKGLYPFSRGKRECVREEHSSALSSTASFSPRQVSIQFASPRVCASAMLGMS